MVKFLHISANNLSFLQAITAQMTKAVSEGVERHVEMFWVAAC